MEPSLPGRGVLKHITPQAAVTPFSSRGTIPVQGAFLESKKKCGKVFPLDIPGEIDLTDEELTLGIPSLCNLVASRLQKFNQPMYRYKCLRCSCRV